jgi:hypothetical protein
MRSPLAAASARATRSLLAFGVLGGVLALPSAQPVPPLSADAAAVLDRFAGTWDVTLTLRRPKPGTETYTQTNTWVLGRRFLRGETSARSSGAQELSMFGYTAPSRTYPLWIFTSDGYVAQLQRGEWNEASRTMAWRSAALDQIQYTSRCTFESATTLRCTTQVNDGKGGLAIDQESVSQRRR